MGYGFQKQKNVFQNVHFFHVNETLANSKKFLPTLQWPISHSYAFRILLHIIVYDATKDRFEVGGGLHETA